MVPLCARCALRLQRAVQAGTRPATIRTFSSTTRAHRFNLPQFVESSQPELDAVLESLRSKHLLPAALSTAERKLIFKPKNKQFLEENPTTVTVGGEDIELEWIDRFRDIPSRKKLIPKAFNLMGKGKKSDWNNLPALLVALHKAKFTPDDKTMGKIVRLATNSGRFGTILQCLNKAHSTAMTMKKEEVLNSVIWVLHQIAQSSGWSEAGTRQAIKDAKVVAMLFEDEEHGSGRYVRAKDPRRRPEVIGVFLELAAVYAWKFQTQRDLDGMVKAYAERLLSNIGGAEKPTTTSPAPTGPQLEMLRGVPIWHGLRLAQKILGSDMPQAELAKRVVQDYESGLEAIAEGLRTRRPKERPTYTGQALKVWSECIRD